MNISIRFVFEPLPPTFGLSVPSRSSSLSKMASCTHRFQHQICAHSPALVCCKMATLQQSALTNIISPPRVSNITFEGPARSLLLTRATAAAGSGGGTEKIRFICVSSRCVGSLICLCVWCGLLSHRACPTLVSLCSSCIPPLQMAYLIRYA